MFDFVCFCCTRNSEKSDSMIFWFGILCSLQLTFFYSRMLLSFCHSSSKSTKSFDLFNLASNQICWSAVFTFQELHMSFWSHRSEKIVYTEPQSKISFLAWFFILFNARENHRDDLFDTKAKNEKWESKIVFGK